MMNFFPLILIALVGGRGSTAPGGGLRLEARKALDAMGALYSLRLPLEVDTLVTGCVWTISDC